MKLFQKSWTREPDAEYIAKLRRSIVLLDRFRLWFVLLYVGLLAVAISLISNAIPFLLNLGQNAAVPAFAVFPVLGFLGGAMIGLAFGWTIHELLHGLTNIIGGFRSERLLIKYYDAAHQEQVDQVESNECVAEK